MITTEEFIEEMLLYLEEAREKKWGYHTIRRDLKEKLDNFQKGRISDAYEEGREDGREEAR